MVCHNHGFIRSPNSKVGSFEIAKIKIAKIISHTLTSKSRKFSSAKISRYTVIDFNHTSWIAVVTPNEHPKSVSNWCVIEVSGGVFVFSLGC